MFNPARQKIPCNVCLDLFKQTKKDDKPDCIKCGFVPIIKENIDFIEIYNKYSFMIGNGMGGINAEAIQMIIDMEKIKDVDWFLKKLNVFYSNGIKVQQKDN